ncbi:PREDICTED: UDP-GalNAc:beta-1,3-N-acetylgalactosaminyltransferase 2-like [Priapulus caudatus]|uniref:Hexosyltransferase n=1 Tax=Priapulus caudatus TaxID=37621 RepID=A0ABM1E7M6_PRICU|nr:PREDICTED: UDP-GalNAc:beta-1,3-N-acetylgalactosaminyltransferase 2-like [Priapulus caudatus]XP_014668198.1 PREDICTED: UDP-GalNAc:beta-1,3-N-acetylgalactosaminyltransferase 2-like [Priapulus caudatus]XP_014668199.1 PREDICTED: UDP-GalNAc:beta-1,3-N-acetylgalactosaminyltransferase 2-like [Priapulus caudatus]
MDTSARRRISPVTTEYNGNLLHWTLVAVAVGGIVSAIFYEAFVREYFTASEEEQIPDMVVAVMSARENFAQRQTIRGTWMQHLHTGIIAEKVHVKFIIGKHGCNMHPDYRNYQHSCDPLQLDAYDISKAKTFNLFKVDRGHENSAVYEFVVVPCLRIFIRNSVIVNKIGVLSNISQPVSVKLLSADGKETVASASFMTGIGEKHHGYIYKAIQPIILPQAFEGLLVAQNIADSVQYRGSSETTAPGLVDVTGMFADEEGIQPVVGVNAISAGSLAFLVQDSDRLKAMISERNQKNNDWHQRESSLLVKLREENARFGDILFTDVTDTYANLPAKLLQCFKLTAPKLDFKYLLKTDDDCYLNLPRIHRELQMLTRSHLWWSNFRVNWPVQRFGKWRDAKYPSALYPPFACGAGYVLSHDLILWLAANSKYLQQYQGEDVSMGIWLAAVGPTFVHDNRWSCDSTCTDDSLSVAQLNSSSMHELWSNEQTCGNPCSCPT